MIDPASIESLKQSIDIVDVIGNYIELKKAGSNYKANCPFHNEKTPSFNVSPSKQIFHCFGCGAGGDAIKFVMDYEKLSYPEAIEKIASFYNFSLSYTKGKGNFAETKRVLDILQNWYRYNLDNNPQSLSYLKERGVSQSSIEDFGIGYVPDGKDVINFLSSKHIPLPKAQEAGVIAQGERGEFYSRLSHRITFPIYSPAGAIVGFGGRTMGNHPAKYINSPQTKLFNKSRLLYGYHRAKEYIFKKREIIICEGYLDVIMFHQAGFKNAVATLGTALTAEHLPLIKKGEPNVILAYDGDSAGVNAALKASKLLASHSFEGKVALFPEGKDPADMVKNGDIDELNSIISEGSSILDFVLEKITESFDLDNPYEKEKAFKEIKDFLNTLSPIVKESVIPKASMALGLSSALFGQSDREKRDKYNKYKIEKIEELKVDVDDPAWSAIIKTLIENERLIDEVLDLITPDMAGIYKDALEALMRGDSEHPKLLKLTMNEKIPILDEELFYKMLRMQMEKFYKMKLQELTKNRDIGYREKSFWIRKIKTDILPRLKKGELVAYESNFTF